MLTRKNLIFLGGPGAGKGTHAVAIAAKYNFKHIKKAVPIFRYCPFVRLLFRLLIVFQIFEVIFQ